MHDEVRCGFLHGLARGPQSSLAPAPAQPAYRSGSAAPALSCLGISHKGCAELQKFRALPPCSSAWSQHVRVATWKESACFSEQVASWITKFCLPAHNKTSIKALYYFSQSVEQACLGPRTAEVGSSVGPLPLARGGLLWHLGGW